MPPASPPHLLLVDDDTTLLEALGAALRDRYRVQPARSGAEALRLLVAHPVDAILLDVRLGEESGLELVEKVRRLSAAPLLILTGHSTEAVAIQALRLGAREYLQKPVGVATLRAALTRLLAAVPPPPGPALVDRARELLAAGAPHGIDPGAAADSLARSERHVRRLFRARFGQTPRQYLAATRVAQAVTLLQTTQASVRWVSERAGFPTVVRFRRLFRDTYGLTPSAYRAAVQGPAGPTPEYPAPPVRK